MKNLKFFILTTSKKDYSQNFYGPGGRNPALEDLKRHFSIRWSNLDYSEAVVIINTIDRKYIRECSAWCLGKGIEFHVTECNGMPGQGKNETLRVFEESEYDYMVQVDGDDYLTPYGVWFYKECAALDNPPDSVCLINSWAANRTEYGQRRYDHSFQTVAAPFDYDKQIKLLKDRSEIAPNAKKYLINNRIVTDVDEEFLHYLKLQKITDTNMQAYGESYHVGEPYQEEADMCETHSRLVFYSKKAAKYRTIPDMTLGEDTYLYYLLKDAYARGEIKMFRHFEIPCTYVYNQTDMGLVRNHSTSFSNHIWMQYFNEEVEELKKQGKVHEFNLPDIEIPYPEGESAETAADYGISIHHHRVYDYDEEGHIILDENIFTNTQDPEVQAILRKIEAVEKEQAELKKEFDNLIRASYHCISKLCALHGQTYWANNMQIEPPLLHMGKLNKTKIGAGTCVIE